MVDFICMGFRRVMSANRELQNEKSCPQWGSNPGLSDYALSVELLELLKIDHL